MSDSIEMTSCLRHRDNTRYFIYYEDLQEISPEHPDKLAAFIRVLEVKTNKRIVAYGALLEDAIKNGGPIPPLNLWLEVSYNDFVHWSLETLGRSSFQTADKVAQKMLLVKSRVLTRPIRPDDPDSPKVPYKEYILVRENAQAAIDKQEAPIQGEDYEKYGETPPVIENIPLLKKTVGMLQETRGDMLKKTRPPVEKNSNLNKDTSNDPKESKKGDTFGASIDDATLTQLQNKNALLEARLEEALKQIEAMRNTPPEPGGVTPTPAGKDDTPSTAVVGGNDQDAILEPVVSPTMPQNSATGINAHQPQDEASLDDSSAKEEISPVSEEIPPNENLRDGGTTGAEPMQGVANEKLRDNSYSPNLTTKPAIPPATETAKPARTRGGKGAGKKEEKPKLEVVKTPPQMPPAEMAWGTRKCMQKFDARRGTLLIGTYTISQASTCAKGLAENYSEEDVDAVTEKMNNDPYWIARGGADICDVARNIHKEIKKIKGQNQPASSQSGNTQQSLAPAACMSHDEACKLAHDVITQAKQHGYDIQAQAVTSKKVEGAWIVKVKWDNEDGFVVPPIRTREQWQKEFKSIHENLSLQVLTPAKREAK